jgi:cobalt ECF transporter T component CbiQ
MSIMKGIDSLAYQSPALKWPPLGKLLLCVCLLIGSLSSRTIYGPLIVLGVGLFLFYYAVNGKAPLFMLYLITGVVIFNVTGTLIIAITQPGEAVWSIFIEGVKISVTQSGIDLAILVFFRTMAGMFVVLFFAASTPVPHIFNALSRLGLPDYIVETTVLIYRYSFMVLEQSILMVNAASCRLGFSGWKNSMKTTGVLAANLFIRSLEFAERSQNALQSRNYTGSFPVFRKPPSLDVKWAVCSISALAAIYAIGNFL